jgi:hypothetical protein
MLKRLSTMLLIGAVGCVVASAALLAQAPAAKPAAQPPPAVKGPRPDQFTYPPLNFKAPKASEFRTTLSNGLVV